MKTEQIIYTSCKQGIQGQSSGYQVYSYSPQMAQWIENRDGVGVLEQYKAPTGPQYPMLPTPEQLEECYPKRSYFGPLSGPDGLYGMALCSYIGRDYPEGSIRGGNFVAHGAAVPLGSMDTYPCAYLESPSFLRTMDVELARSDKRPAMLPQLDLARNNSIGFEDVQQFLMEEDHADLFKLMLACFLTREQDGALHRIIIRDSAENFNMWVAALQMALPVRQSLTYPFSTYEYDLLATDAHVVRAVDGMSGTLASLAVNAFVFDMDNEVPLPQPVADETVEQLCEFVTDSMQYSPESLQAFHRFLDATDYTAADRGVADAYNLLQLSVGVMEFHELDVQSAGQALAFMRDHCGADVQRKVANQLFAEARANLLDDGQRELLRDVLAYIARNDRSYAVTARESALDLLFDVFTASDPKQAVYDQAYDIAHAVFDAIGQNVDVVLFDELTDNPEVNLGLNGTPGSALPWTVDAYARWTAQSILTAGGTAIRPGMPARQMQAALGQRNANALDKIIKVIVHHPDTAGTGMLVQEFAGTLSSNDLLGCMIDLLIILEGDPQAASVASATADTGVLSGNVDKAYQAFRTMYAGQRDSGLRLAYLQSCYGSGLVRLLLSLLNDQARQSQPDPQSYFRFLDQVVRQMPPEFAANFSAFLATTLETAMGPNPAPAVLCDCARTAFRLLRLPRKWYQGKVDQAVNGIAIINVGEAGRMAYNAVSQLLSELGSNVHVPERVPLIEYQLTSEQLAVELSQKHYDPARVTNYVQFLAQRGPTLPLSAAGTQAAAFTVQVADQITGVVMSVPQGRDLQLYALPVSQSVNVIKRVLDNVISGGKLDDILVLLAVDVQCVDALSRQSAMFEADALTGEIAAFAASRMSGVRIKSSDVLKLVQDEKKFGRHIVDRFQNTYGVAFPSPAFNGPVDLIVQDLEHREQNGPKGFEKVMGWFSRR